LAVRGDQAWAALAALAGMVDREVLVEKEEAVALSWFASQRQGF
jgi:hypothetical protein